MFIEQSAQHLLSQVEVDLLNKLSHKTYMTRIKLKYFKVFKYIISRRNLKWHSNLMYSITLSLAYYGFKTRKIQPFIVERCIVEILLHFKSCTYRVEHIDVNESLVQIIDWKLISLLSTSDESYEPRLSSSDFPYWLQSHIQTYIRTGRCSTN